MDVEVIEGLSKVHQCFSFLSQLEKVKVDRPADKLICELQDIALNLGKVLGANGVPDGKDKAGGMLHACQAVAQMVLRLTRLCNAKAFQLMINNPCPDTAWNYKALLEPGFHAVAESLCCMGSMQKDIETLESSAEPKTLEDMVTKLTLLETATSALKVEIVQKDPLFAKTAEDMQKYISSYLTALPKAVKLFEDSHVSIFSGFIAEYSEVAEAAKEWQMASVASTFQDNYQTTKEAVEQVIAAKTNIAGSLKALSTLCSHGTGNDALKQVLQDCKGSYDRGVEAETKAREIGGIILVSALLLSPNPTSQDAKATWETTQQTFGLKKEQLPSKMLKLLTDLIQTKNKDTEDAKPQGSSKRKKNDKEREGEKPEKGVKSKKTEKEKDEKEERKSKKSKKQKE